MLHRTFAPVRMTIQLVLGQHQKSRRWRKYGPTAFHSMRHKLTEKANDTNGWHVKLDILLMALMALIEIFPIDLLMIICFSVLEVHNIVMICSL
jgi:hypothetical protein